MDGADLFAGTVVFLLLMSPTGDGGASSLGIALGKQVISVGNSRTSPSDEGMASHHPIAFS